MTLEESREIIPLMESMIGQIEEQQTLMAEMILEMQNRKNKIPAQMPSEVKVANKTGELDHVENDAGIIYDTAKGIDLVVCFMSQDLNDTSDAQNTIAQDSRAIYGYYNE